MTTLLATLFLSLPAQPGAGDYVIANFTPPTGSQLFVHNVTTRARTLNVALPGHQSYDVIVDPDDNESWLEIVDDKVLRVDGAGGVSTFLTVPFSGGTGIAADEDGTFVVLAGNGVLYRFTRAGVVTTVASGLGGPFARPAFVRWDVDTGNYIVGLTGGTASIVRVDRAGNVSVLVPTPISSLMALDQHVPSGDFLAVRQTELLRVGPTGAVRTLASGMPELNFAWSCTVLPVGHPDGGGNVAVGRVPLDPNAGSGLYVFDPNTGALLTTVLSFSPPAAAGFQPVGLAINGSRALSGEGPASPGSAYRMKIRNAAATHAGRVYVMAASLAARPGIPLPGGRELSLAPDGLFLLTVANQLPTVFRNFAGVLDAQGDADAFVNLPPSPALLGLRTYYGCVVLDATGPGGILTVSNTHAFTIRP